MSAPDQPSSKRPHFAAQIIQFPLVRVILEVTCVALSVVIAQMVIALLRQSLNLRSPLPALFVVFEIVLTVAAVYLAYAASVRWIERRSVSELSARVAVPEAGLGVLVGAGMLTILVAILWLAGSYHATGTSAPSVVLGALAADIPSAGIQQVIFQGIIFRITAQWLGTWWALALTVSTFTGLHVLLIPQMTVTGLLAILFGETLFIAAYLSTRRLWFPSALHASLDFTQDGIFGIGAYRLSGVAAPGLVQAYLSGPTFLTGGAFGVEASVVTLLLLVGSSVIMLVWAQRHRHVVPSLSGALRRV